MNRMFLEEFIKIYQNEPSLWQIENKCYRDKRKKQAGYVKLIKKLKEIEPDATRKTVIKKINCLRTAYRKEQRKVLCSIRSGAKGDDIYKPKLWYYPLLRFIDKSAAPVDYQINIKTEIDNDNKTDEVDDVNDNATTNHPVIYISRVPKQTVKVVQSQQMRQEAVQPVQKAPINNLQSFSNPFKKHQTSEDRFDVVGKTFAWKLRSLPNQQMLIAEKLMNDVLFYAEMGSLTLSHQIVARPTQTFLQFQTQDMI